MTFWSPIVWGHLTIESHFHHPKKVSSRIARNASNELVKLNHFSEIWMNTFSDSNPPLREPPSVSLFQAPRNPSFALHQLLEFLAVRLPVKGSRWPFFEVFLAFIISGKWRFLGIPLQKNVIFCIAGGAPCKINHVQTHIWWRISHDLQALLNTPHIIPPWPPGRTNHQPPQSFALEHDRVDDSIPANQREPADTVWGEEILMHLKSRWLVCWQQTERGLMPICSLTCTLGACKVWLSTTILIHSDAWCHMQHTCG